MNLQTTLHLYENNKIIMHETKPYSRSLKNIITGNKVQAIKLKKFFAQPQQSQNTTEVSAAKLPTNRPNIQRSSSGPITPLKLKTKDANEHLPNTEASLLHKDNTVTKINQTSFLPRRGHAVSHTHVRSKLEESIDQVMNQLIRRQKLPILHKGIDMEVTKRNYRNIRILTEPSDASNHTHNLSRSNEDDDYLERAAANLTRIKQKIKQNFKKQKLVDSQSFFVPSRISTHLDLSKAVKKSKEVLSYFPITQYRDQQKHVQPLNIIECYEHIRHFREDKSISKRFSLRKS